MNRRLLIDRATVFDSAAGTLRPRCRIVIEGERIAAVTDEPIQVDDVASTFDAADRVVLPGLIDAHVHVVASSHDLSGRSNLVRFYFVRSEIMYVFIYFGCIRFHFISIELSF